MSFLCNPDQVFHGNNSVQPCFHTQGCAQNCPVNVIYNVSRNLIVIHTIHLAGGAFKMTQDFPHSLTILSLFYFICHRKLCLKRSSYMALGTNKPPPPSPATNEFLPICPADKPKRRRWISNIFINDRGFSDKSDQYDNLLHNIEGRPILQKL